MDRLDCMRAFIAVADTGSFTTAARKLGLSRALVSKRVAALEKTFHVRLFNRTTRRLSVTGTGSEFHDRCARILEEFDAAAAEITAQQAEPAGTLKVNGPMSFGTRHLAPVVAAFMARYPKVRVELILNDRLVDLVGEGFDVGVRIGALADSSLTARRLVPVQRVLCAAPGYLAAAGAPETVADLKRHRCLHYGYLASGTRWKLTGPGGLQAVDIEPALCANNGDVLREAAMAGQGVALLPTFLCADALADGRLVRVLAQFEGPEIAVNLIWPSNRLLSARVRRFIDFLADRLSSSQR